MFLRVLKTNQAYNLILIPLIGVVFWTVNIVSPKVYDFLPGENQMVLFKPVYILLSKYPLIQVLVSLSLFILLGFLLQRLNNQYALYRVRTLLPSSLLILLVSGISGLHVLHPVYFAAIFFLFAIDRAFGAYENKIISSNSFDTGLLLGIGSLFYFNLIFLFPVLALGMRIIKHDFNWRNLVLNFAGFILPWLFAFSYFFIFDKIKELLLVLNQNLLIHDNRLYANFPIQIYAGFWAFLLLISSFSIIRKFDEKKISTRKYYTVFLLLIISLVGILFLSPSASVEIFVLIAIPSSYVISGFLLSIKSRFWSELIFIILVGLIICMQFASTFFPLP
jgi:hypothetical protein